MDLSNELTQNSLEIPAVVVPSGPKHERPVTAPNAVHEVAARLLAAYTVDGGQVHLAGCQFEERPFLRCQTERGDVFLTAEGSLAESTLVAELGLSTTRQLEEAPARLSAAQLRTMQAAARSLDGLTSTVPTVVWARHAAGALQFTFGIESVRLPFAGWAQTVDPAPCVCPLSGRETFHLAATDDGAIVAAEEIGICAKSQRREIKQNLVECAVTGHTVCVEYTAICPVLGRPALREEFAQCSTCRQQVCAAALAEATCSACANLRLLTTDDPRRHALVSQHPQLATWRRWWMAETTDRHLIQVAGLWRKLFVVLDRSTGACQHLASGHRGSKAWTDVDPARWTKLLGEPTT